MPNGRATSITGSSVTYAGGGGGGGQNGFGAGGTGGGGGGRKNEFTPVLAVAGTENTGGGGGGGGGANGSNLGSRAGGSGQVILRYLTSAGTITIGAGLTGSTATDGSHTVTTITAGQEMGVGHNGTLRYLR
jgi:hypothetical protein